MAQFVKNEMFTFDDVLLIPRFCDIQSRQDVSLKTRLTRNINIDAPIISANMDTVTELEMMKAMRSMGCVGILHRFMGLDKTLEQIRSFDNSPLCVSIGVNGDSKERLDLFIDFGVDVLCIDVAHGHSQAVVDMIKTCKRKSGKIQIIAGNIATFLATRMLIDAGADAIKVGIGPGSMCTTRIVTGNGVPQLSAIINCVEAASGEVPIIADGGIRNSGDIVKALAAGAETVMVGSLFSGTQETPGEIISDTSSPLAQFHKQYKKYRGMASNDAMIGWKGRGYHAAPEGESKLVEYKGPVENIVKPLLAGIRSGMTYQGSRNLEELRRNAIFTKVSANSVIENQPHGKV